MISPATLSKLRSILGDAHLLTSDEDRLTYSYDGTPVLKQRPDAIAIPDSVDQISQIVRLAHEDGFSVVPRGSGTGLSGGSIPVENCLVVLTNHWNKIQEIDTENLTAWVQPGVITGHLHSEVEKRGLLYAPDPGSSSICTIGGNVAENAGGLRGYKYGVTKDYVLGIEVVLPSGDVVLAGGKAVKNVAGYNLKDLLIGSEGTLGIFTRILVKLIPKPESSRTMLAYFDRMTQAAETVSAIVAAKITPSALEFLDQMTIKCVEDYAHLGMPTSMEAVLLIEVDGRSSVVDEEIETISRICRERGAASITLASTDEEAAKLRMARKVAFAALARVKPTTILEDATVPRSEVAPMVEFVARTARQMDLQFGNFGHAGDGNLHPTCLTDERDSSAMRRAESAFEKIYSEALRLGGTITGEHGVGLSKLKFLNKALGAPQVELMRQVKLAFDPDGILNPGKIFSLKPRCEGPMPRRREELNKLFEMGAYT